LPTFYQKIKDKTMVPERGLGHAYFSAEKSRDPASRRRAPAFKSPTQSFALLVFQKNLLNKNKFRIPK